MENINNNRIEIEFPNRLIPQQIKLIIFNIKNYLNPDGRRFNSESEEIREISRISGVNPITVKGVLYMGLDAVNRNAGVKKGRPKGRFVKVDEFKKGVIKRKIYQNYSEKKVNIMIKNLKIDKRRENIISDPKINMLIEFLALFYPKIQISHF